MARDCCSSFFIFGIARDELEDNNYFTSISPVMMGRCMIQYAVPEEPNDIAELLWRCILNFINKENHHAPECSRAMLGASAQQALQEQEPRSRVQE